MNGNAKKHPGTLTKEAKQIFIPIRVKQGPTQNS